MTVIEKIAYTKGFFSGLEIDGKSKEGKAFNALLELLEELVVSNSDLEKECENLKSRVSGIDEHVAEVFNNVFDNASYGPGHEGHHHDAVLFEVVCPECDTKTSFGQSIAFQGRMNCPGCGISLEFDYDNAPQDEGTEMVDEILAEPVLPIQEAVDAPISVDTLSQAEAQEETATVSLQKPEQPGIIFSAAPPVPESEGERDQIPQTEEFVYSESTEDDEEAGTGVKLEKAVETSSAEEIPVDAAAPAEEAPIEEIPAEKAETESDEQTPPADEQEEKTEGEAAPEDAAEGKEDPAVRSALVKIDFAPDPEAFEAGRKKAEEYKYSVDNVSTDFNALVPDKLETPDGVDA